MPGLAGRMSTVMKAKISRLLDKSEDPGETLDYGYQKQVEHLQNVKKGVADVVTSKKRLQLQQQKLEQQVVKLDTQARQALSQGKEDLARTALERKTVAQTELQSLDQQVTELEAQQEALTASEQKLRGKIEAFRTKKEVIKAQYSAAEAQVKISEAATGVGEEMADVGLAMQRAVDKTEGTRARERDGRARGRRCVRRQPDAHGRPGRHRPSARRAHVGQRGRRRPRTHEGRARPGLAAVAGARGGEARRPADPRRPAVIVRIATEDQYRLPDEDAERLNELDNQAVTAVEAGDEDRFRAVFEEMLQL